MNKLKNEVLEQWIARNTIQVEPQPMTSHPRIVSVSETLHVKEVHAQHMHHFVLGSSSSSFAVILNIFPAFFAFLRLHEKGVRRYIAIQVVVYNFK